MLRPPTTASTPSAMNSLLCMRRLMRSKSCIDSSTREAGVPLRTGSGLKMRTSAPARAPQPPGQAVAAGGVEVVPQQPDAHAAGGRLRERAQEAPAGVVRRDQVVLHV